MTSWVPTDRAEAATRLLFQTLAGHRALIAAFPRPKRTRRLAPAVTDRAQIQRQATLVRLVSITESFCAERLLLCAEDQIQPAGKEVTSKIWEEAALDATRTWDSQKKAFKDWLSVTPDWKQIEGLAEARNAVAHGLGALTRRQRRAHQSTMTKLNRTGILVQNDQVVLTDADLVRAAQDCRDLIGEVDRLTP